jgi:hypothetical protein
MSNMLQLNVPKIVERPRIPAICCAVPAAFLIRKKVAAIPGVQRVTAKDGVSQLTIIYDPEHTNTQAIFAFLDRIGYPAQATA